MNDLALRSLNLPAHRLPIKLRASRGSARPAPRRGRVAKGELVGDPGHLALGVAAGVALAAFDRVLERQRGRRSGRRSPACRGRASREAPGRACAPTARALPPARPCFIIVDTGVDALVERLARRRERRRRPTARLQHGRRLAVEAGSGRPVANNTSSARAMRCLSLARSARRLRHRSRPARIRARCTSASHHRARLRPRTLSGIGGISERPSVSAIR